MDQQRLCN